MIGRVYQSKDDTRRARVWQRADGRWDLEIVRRWEGGGWSHMVSPTPEEGGEDEIGNTYRDEPEVLMHMADWIGAGLRAMPAEIHVATLTEGWPARPVYKTPDGAPEIKAGQCWRKGKQVTRVLAVSRDEKGRGHGLRITTQNLISARESVGTQIRNRKPAEWTYDEQTFRAKFKLEEKP